MLEMLQDGRISTKNKKSLKKNSVSSNQQLAWNLNIDTIVHFQTLHSLGTEHLQTQSSYHRSRTWAWCPVKIRNSNEDWVNISNYIFALQWIQLLIDIQNLFDDQELYKFVIMLLNSYDLNVWNFFCAIRTRSTKKPRKQSLQNNR